MTGNEINLSQMLTRREERACEQKTFLEKYRSPLISFTLNIPGPVKTNESIRRAFESGKISILKALENTKINDSLEVHEDTGDELLLSVSGASPEELKKISVEIENSDRLGRLFDIDVIDADGKKLSRGNFRKCLICGKQAQECARSRAHSVEEMQAAVERLLGRLYLPIEQNAEQYP
ncbi:MAG: citrate lyase holo-[Synergistaceae bacterium]|nr:citrate lyase holo-[acyl-carrier protein] synthase [Synergistaceae bacterium]